MDLEADIFYFTLAGKSGRFYWNQKTGRYQSDPYSNIRIIDHPYSAGFEITDDDGTIYEFREPETSQSSGAFQGPLTTNSWFVSRIYNANKTDSLVFNYTVELVHTRTINSGSIGMYDPCGEESARMSTTSIQSKNIAAIHFGTGYVQFIRDTAERQDLQGGHALAAIEVYDKGNNLKRKWGFEYNYLTANFNDQNCSIIAGISPYESKRLMLKRVLHYNARNSESYEEFKMNYDTLTPVPCRVSFGQDYWGYFNGKVNTTLVPTTIIAGPSGPQVLAGANRLVDINYPQFGILTKLTYPTGGSTSFIYESNQGIDMPSNSTYVKQIVDLEGQEDPNATTFLEEFSINNPPDYFLNNNTPGGGAFINAVFGDLGCEINGQANPCALLTLRGLDPGNSHINFYVTAPITASYVPNGRYEMKASFTQSPPMYQSFFFIIDFQRIDTTGPDKHYTGGLRLKQAIHSDESGNQYNRYYSYVTELGGDTSSGDMFGPSYEHFIKKHLFTCYWYNDIGDCLHASGFRLLSDPTATIASHSGSYIGYKTVFEYVDSAHEQGVTRYDFSHEPDIFDVSGAFPPGESRSEFRGKPIKVTNYKKDNGQYKVVSKTVNTYNNVLVDSLKVLNLHVLITANYTCTPFHECMEQDQLSIQSMYEATPTISLLESTKETLYDLRTGTTPLEKFTRYIYDESYRLSETVATTSKGDSIRTKQYYPNDLALSGAHETAKLGLISQNRIGEPLRQEVFNNSTLRQRRQTNYKQYQTALQYLPDEILEKNGTGLEEARIRFVQYDQNGNLLSQQKVDDALHSYIYGYNNCLPIAEILNGAASDVFFTSFEDTDGNSTTGDSKTGLKSRTGGFSKALSGIGNGKYILSYWNKNGSNWSLVSTEVTVSTNSFTINLNGQLDEVRFYPKSSRISTFTFDPIYGITSLCDANNIVTYYEYDGFGRLQLVRDQYRNIIKQYCYNYSGQLEDCSQ
ncbi:hypothetical protein DLD77_01290 [Chitinophaga alhagiae]|uniref:Sugar-binding protein n=2 Tax=Chitinophaga alhagiae TaxID=2203219 RepID=A0ABM6W995_9BACT|nr:hypothetical protein DLD77_01290 [Chitinophaga alhagiae]